MKSKQVQLPTNTKYTTICYQYLVLWSNRSFGYRFFLSSWCLYWFFFLYVCENYSTCKKRPLPQNKWRHIWRKPLKWWPIRMWWIYYHLVFLENGIIDQNNGFEWVFLLILLYCDSSSACNYSRISWFVCSLGSFDCCWWSCSFSFNVLVFPSISCPSKID